MMISDFLEGVKTVGVTGHIRPDGDCVGSILALYGYILNNHPDVEVDLFLEPPTTKLSFLKYFDRFNTAYDIDRTYDLFICLDSASRERIGKAEKYFASAKHTINIDHHVSNPGFADENYVFPGGSSCCEALYGFMDPEKIDRDIAIALYTGIVYDTGVFKYPSTTPQTMRVAADLMEYDIPTNYIVDESFFAKTYDENRIFGYAVLNSKLALDGRVIYSYTTKADLKKFGVSGRELEGIVSQLRLTRGVQCAICLHEISPSEYKVSLRSGDEVDVNEVAMQFGGGGHARAAGCTLKGNIDECIDQLINALSDAVI